MKLWISASFATGQVDIDENLIIISTPPIWIKFRGQRIENLILWLKSKSKGKLIIKQLRG